MPHTKRIEELAINALETALLRCPFLEAYIGSNDKTPSWDGNVLVYRSTNGQKKDILGKVPIQVKGTEKQYEEKENVAFSAEVVDLKNYYNDGGIVYFLVSVDPFTSTHKIFYSSLLTYDLDYILKIAEGQDTYSIQLSIFPENSSNEMATIFMSFLQNRPRQMSFIGKEILSLEKLEGNGASIESISFGATGIGFKQEDIESFITTHDFYLYAKLKGLDVDVPVDKVTNAILCKEISKTVTVNGVVYYDSYSAIFKKGKAIFRIGRSMQFLPQNYNEKATLKFTPKGTLSERLKDIAFVIDALKNKGFSLNGIDIPFNNVEEKYIENYQERYKYLLDVKKMLELLGVTEELQCDSLSRQDETNIYNFVGCILYKRHIGFPGLDATVIFGPFNIGNLSIQIWASKHEDGYYDIDNFFNPHSIVCFDPSDESKQPIPISQYVVLKKEAFEHSSNMNYERIYESIVSSPRSAMFFNEALLLVLEMLKGYDAQKVKDNALLDLADRLCDWICEEDDTTYPALMNLNKLQIVKRKRDFTLDELVTLAELKKAGYPANVRCGAYILIGDQDNAQKCFDEIDCDARSDFIEYPICYFAKLKNSVKPN